MKCKRKDNDKNPSKAGNCLAAVSAHEFVCILNLSYCCDISQVLPWHHPHLTLSEDQNREKLFPES